MYDVTGSLPREAVSEFEPGTNLLVTGPPLTGKREFTFDLLADGHDDGDGMLFVMTSESAAVVIEDLCHRRLPLDKERIGVVDCLNNENQTIENVATKSLPSPRDLTGISGSAATLFRKFSNHGVSKIRHGLISVSTLLAYLDHDTVFKFLYIYMRRITETEGLGVFTIDNTAHDPQVVDTLASEFDGVVELRRTDAGQRELRIQGLADVPETWYGLDEG